MFIWALLNRSRLIDPSVTNRLLFLCLQVVVAVGHYPARASEKVARARVGSHSGGLFVFVLCLRRGLNMSLGARIRKSRVHLCWAVLLILAVLTWVHLNRLRPIDLVTNKISVSLSSSLARVSALVPCASNWGASELGRIPVEEQHY